RRSPSQMTAYIVLGFRSSSEANDTIQQGIDITYCSVHCHRLAQEPQHCLKCQKLTTHMVAECTSGKDVCGICGGEHWTRECTETNSHKWNCQNCRCNGHASWDRNCPAFQKKNDELQRLHYENDCKFFPITE
ncbi:hypothetical protein M422DRAFT_79558, partial [Sphaerobolus stellatus SS14]